MAEIDYGAVKTGKAPVRTDVRTLLFGRYVRREELPQAPSEYDLSDRVSEWPMYGNDRLGDCTCAAAGHMIEAWTGEAGKPVEMIGEDAVLTAYEAVKAPEGEGAIVLDVLNYWRKSGIGDHRTGACAKVPSFDQAVVRVAAYIFGGLYLGAQLPLSAKAQIHAGQPWDWTGELGGESEPGSWGGHAIDVVKYDDSGVTVVTWGRLQEITWAFWERYVDECYCMISEDYLTGERDTPAGFDMETLTRDLELVKSR